MPVEKPYWKLTNTYCNQLGIKWRRRRSCFLNLVHQYFYLFILSNFTRTLVQIMRGNSASTRKANSEKNNFFSFLKSSLGFCEIESKIEINISEYENVSSRVSTPIYMFNDILVKISLKGKHSFQRHSFWTNFLNIFRLLGQSIPNFFKLNLCPTCHTMNLIFYQALCCPVFFTRHLKWHSPGNWVCKRKI